MTRDINVHIMFDIHMTSGEHIKKYGMSNRSFLSEFTKQYGMNFSDYRYERLVEAYQNEVVTGEISSAEFIRKYRVGHSLIFDIRKTVTGNKNLLKAFSPKSDLCVSYRRLGMRVKDIEDMFGIDKSTIVRSTREIVNGKKEFAEKRICDLFKSGLKIHEIAKSLSCTTEKVKITLMKNCLIDRPEYITKFGDIALDMVRGGSPVEEIIRELGLSVKQYSTMAMVLGFRKIRKETRNIN